MIYARHDKHLPVYFPTRHVYESVASSQGLTSIRVYFWNLFVFEIKLLGLAFLTVGGSPISYLMENSILL